MKTKLFLALGTLAITSGFLNAQITNPAPYCQANPANFVNDQILNVSINTLNNLSGGLFNNSRYVYFSNLNTLTLTVNATHTMNVVVSRPDCMKDILATYIDANGDNQFTANELVGSVSPAVLAAAPCGGNATATFNYSLTIPTTKFTGVTRMRVIYTGYGAPAPCFATPTMPGSMGTGGEVEDYNVYLSAANPIQAPVANFALPATSCINQVINLVDNSSNIPTAWSWTLTGATPSVSNAQNQLAIYPNPGTYTVSLASTNAGGTSSVLSKTISISACNVGVNELEGSDVKNITVYPNPTSGAFAFDLKLAGQVAIYNLLGDQIFAKNLEPGKHTIDISNQTAGIYFLRVNTENKQQQIKIIKE